MHVHIIAVRTHLEVLRRQTLMHIHALHLLIDALAVEEDLGSLHALSASFGATERVATHVIRLRLLRRRRRIKRAAGGGHEADRCGQLRGGSTGDSRGTERSRVKVLRRLLILVE